MKKFILFILAVIPMLFGSCSDDDIRFSIPGIDDQMHLTASQSDVTLDQNMGDETAITFTWGKAQDRGEGTKINYYFKMDLESNNFENSIDKIYIPEGQNSVSFTHKQLNSYLKMWGITPGSSAVVQGEIIAEVTGGSHYMKPEISTTTVNVTGYEIQPRPLYIFKADATEGDGIEMVEVLSETQYKYTGVLEAGDYKIAKTVDGDPVMTFHVDKSAFCVVNADLSTMEQPTITYPVAEINKLYMVGDACAAGWSIKNSLVMKQDAVNKFQFTWTGQLSAGELKFPLDTPDDWSCDFIMAATENQSITDPKATKRNQPDTKWKVLSGEAGKYKITVDTYNMTVTFEKQKEEPLPEVPADVKIKNIWAWGSATENNWTYPFFLPFRYDASAPKGTFVIETTLKEGEMKFGLENDPSKGDNIGWLRPLKEDVTNDLAPLSATKIKQYQGSSPDYKWKVTAAEAGDYKISINVINMTVKFEKK